MNIFPCRKTVLHCFVENCFNLKKKGSSVNNQELVLALFKTCEKGLILTAAEMKTKASVTYEIPIIEDCHGRTPFDIALNIPLRHESS